MNYSLTPDEISNYQNKVNQEANKVDNDKRKMYADLQSTVLNALSLPTNNPGQPIEQKPVNSNGAWNGR